MMRACTSGLLAASLLLLALASPAMAQSEVSLAIDSFADYDRSENVSVLQRPHPEYDPLGVRAGAFLLFPKLVLGGGATDNALATNANERSSAIATLAPSLTARSQWSRHALEIGGGAQLRRYSSSDSENETAWWLDARGRLDALESSRIEFGVHAGKRYEDRLEANAPVGAVKPASYIVKEAFVRGVYELTRVRFILASDVMDLDYADELRFTNGTVSHDNRDQTLLGASARGEVAISPNFALFAQGGYRASKYKDKLPAIGFNRDSDEASVALGASIDSNALIRGEIAVGYLQRDYASAAYGTISGLYVKAHAEYFPTSLITITAAAERSVEDSAFLGTGGYFSNKASLRADYELRRNLVLSAEGGYGYDDFRSFDRRDRVKEALAEVRYLMNRKMTVNAQLKYTARDSRGLFARPDYDVLRVACTLTVQW